MSSLEGYLSACWAMHRICCQNETLQQFLTLRFRGDEAEVPETSDLAILLCPVTIAPQAVRKPTSKSSVAFAHPHAPFQFHSLRRSLLPAIASVTSRKGGDLLLVLTAKIQFASSSLGLVYPTKPSQEGYVCIPHHSASYRPQHFSEDLIPSMIIIYLVYKGVSLDVMQCAAGKKGTLCQNVHMCDSRRGGVYSCCHSSDSPVFLLEILIYNLSPLPYKSLCHQEARTCQCESVTLAPCLLYLWCLGLAIKRLL